MKVFLLIATVLFGNVKECLFSTSMDASEVTWAHAVNSKELLEENLKNDINFLEADVSLGDVTGPNPEYSVPIMAHPPKMISDISLQSWIERVINAKTGKGVKLDFKSIEIVEPSLKILKDHETELTFPIWLNADILPGPINADTEPVNSTAFLKLCKQYFPDVTLSVGWTTRVVLTAEGSYTWHHIKEMLDTLHCTDTEQPVTFPVRAIFVKNSIDQLVWLLGAIPNSTLTVWSSLIDVVDVESLLKLRSRLPFSAVYYDLPPTLLKQFNDRKGSVHPPSVPYNFNHYNWVPISDKEECNDKIYISSLGALFPSGFHGLMLKMEPQNELEFISQIAFINSEAYSSLRLIVCKDEYFPSVLSSGKDLIQLLQESSLISYTFDNREKYKYFKLTISAHKVSLLVVFEKTSDGKNIQKTIRHDIKLIKNINIVFLSEGESVVLYNAESETVSSSTIPKLSFLNALFIAILSLLRMMVVGYGKM